MFTINKFSVILVMAILSLPAPDHAQDAQLINATSVPQIAVAIDGRLLYPNFPQGLYTAGSATDTARVVYKIKDLRGGSERTLTMDFAPGSRQALVIYGDFSPLANPSAKRKTTTPNVKLFSLDYALASDESRLRYRVANLIPNQIIRLLAEPEPVEIPPGQSFAIGGQKGMVTLQVQIGAEKIPVPIRQRQVLRNCDIIFYETGTGAAFIRFFEPGDDANGEPAESLEE
jgi:hypothetical protein